MPHVYIRSRSIDCPLSVSGLDRLDVPLAIALRLEPILRVAAMKASSRSMEFLVIRNAFPRTCIVSTMSISAIALSYSCSWCLNLSGAHEGPLSADAAYIVPATKYHLKESISTAISAQLTSSPPTNNSTQSVPPHPSSPHCLSN